METVSVNLGGRSYRILINANWIDDLGARLCDVISADRLLVITTPALTRLYGRIVLDALRAAGYSAELFEIPEGEKRKTVATVETIWDHLIRNGYTRQSVLVALGGGVVGDIAGFAAATYMRGVGFVQTPTSLLAMIDSSIGGKTGVNHPQAKNVIGAFWQPKIVFVDTAFLRSLAPSELRTGFAEAVKHGVIRDSAYFQFLEQNLDAILGLDDAALIHTVRVSCEIKAGVVARDEREAGLRAILNFGHTLGHAAESLSRYEIPHGQAVSIGMVGEARIAEKMGLVTSDAVARLSALLERAGLPTRFPDFPAAAVLERLKSDKKVKDGRVRFVLPTRIGEVVIRDDVPSELVASVVS